ncbi:MAG: L,D-transpeptidase [Chitinophagaceae bacterium]|nr:L,D-transpeptidase [Chitinophagaceae bacterium]
MGNKLTKILEIDAHGGPAAPTMGGDNHMKTPTTAGRYIIHTIEKHVSYGKYAYWSGVAWGTPLRFVNGITEVKLNGIWQKLSSVNSSWGAYKDKEAVLTQTINNEYQSYKAYYKNANLDRWVFNDFGHVSVKYFKDRNHDRKLNGKEFVMGDFLHATPGDEAISYFNDHSTQKINRALSESHGCVHLRPADIDTLIEKEYLKRGNTIEIHPYTERTVPLLLQRNDAKPFFEFHVFPGINKAVVYNVH